MTDQHTRETYVNLPEEILNNLLEGCQLIGHDERYLYINEAALIHGRKSREDLMGRTLCESFPGIEDTEAYIVLKRCLNEKKSHVMENEFVYADGSRAWFELRFEPVPEGAFILSIDITQRKQMETSRQDMVDLLNLISSAEDQDLFLNSVLKSMKEWSKCEAVGIRIKDGDDYPYYATLGFPESFVQKESRLCAYGEKGRVLRDDQGESVLECMCGNIIQGRYNSSEPCFTDDGSFWVESTSDCMINTRNSYFKDGLRNHCHKMGYESLALIPIRSGDKTFGLLQFCDKKRARFSRLDIDQFRWMADNIAIFLAKKEAQEDIHRLNLRLERLTQVVQDLSPISKLETIRDIVLRAAQELLASDSASCVLSDGDLLIGHDNPFPLDYISQWTMMHRELVEIDDLGKDNPIIQGRDCPISITSLLVIPIRAKDPVGTIGVYWANHHQPTRGDRQILQTLADSASVAMERIRVYKDLERSQQQYRDLVENLNDVVFYLDIHGRFMYISPAIKTFGFLPEEFMGQDFDMFAHPDDAPELKKMIISTLSGYDGSYEFRAQDKKGEIYHIRLSSRAVRQDGNAVGITGVMMDMTGKRRAEEQIKIAQRMEAIGTLAGGIAHDFNNILSSIIGFTELSMDEVAEDSELGVYLHETFSAANRARELVKQILTFARQADEKVKPIQVSAIAKEALKFIRSSTPSTIKINQDIRSEALIMGNATQVHQVFMNLFTNAVHAMEENGGVLEVVLKETFIDENSCVDDLNLKPGPYLLLTVSDTGIGIDPAIVHRVFQPYFTTKEVGKGTGMGLSIVHGIIESYGGEIKVSSQPGHGAVFSVYLPVTDDCVVNLLDKQETLPQGNERILYVDDEYAIARMGTQVLERMGYQVVMRTDSLDALMLFRERPGEFDLVITDMTMPLMTGDKLAMEMIKIRNDIPIILCTGYNNKISSEKARRIGIKAFAHKPVLKADIASVVRRVLDEAKGVEHA